MKIMGFSCKFSDQSIEWSLRGFPVDLGIGMVDGLKQQEWWQKGDMIHGDMVGITWSGSKVGPLHERRTTKGLEGWLKMSP